MKVFYTNYPYRGRYFDIKFCAKTKKEACEYLNYSYAYLRDYVHCDEIDEPFTGVKATPYGHSAVRDIGHRNEMDFEEAKKIIDAVAKKEMDKMAKKYKE